jgi:hypothetical protein
MDTGQKKLRCVAMPLERRETEQIRSADTVLRRDAEIGSNLWKPTSLPLSNDARFRRIWIRVWSFERYIPSREACSRCLPRRGSRKRRHVRKVAQIAPFQYGLGSSPKVQNRSTLNISLKIYYVQICRSRSQQYSYHSSRDQLPMEIVTLKILPVTAVFECFLSRLCGFVLECALSNGSVLA